MGESVTITGLGRQGDGIAEDGRFVVGALPGETWRLNDDQSPELAGPPSCDRIEPVCQHFEHCGGCVAQHMSTDAYRAWKRQIAVDALAREDIGADLGEMFCVPSGTRRRATFQIAHRGGDVRVGFHERRGHTVFDMVMCPVMASEIVAALPALRKIGALLGQHGGAKASVTHVSDGLTVSIRTGKKNARLRPETQTEIAKLTRAMPCLRLTIDGEVIAARGDAMLTFGQAHVAVPDSCFLQAVPAAEQAMQRLVLDGIAGIRKVADLFCGAGTFALPAAEFAQVTAYDSDGAAIDALNDAVRHTQGLKPVQAMRRDLFRQPLGARELKGIGGVIINPPRAGARSQCLELAASDVKRVVMVSCNPTTFARDARILIDGGFSMSPVTPIDQFLWSHHVEVVATFSR
ncbi:MAG: class I SAM-dependent RNA methyltransferase [Hyphomicrobiaceae bacterium]